MRHETISLGGCPVIRPEGIYLDGRRVIALTPGLSGGVGLGDVGDLLAYRQEWQPFVFANRDIWRHLNELFEGLSDAQKCPTGIFSAAEIQKLDPTLRSLCATLALTRIRTSDTDPGGIMTQWNAWKNKSSAEVLEGAKDMLEWHQEVVLRVGGQYANELLEISKIWGVPVEFPDLPSFSTQQEIIARIQGAFIAAKGALQIIGYGVGKTLTMAGNVTEAVAQGLTDTAKQLPKTVSTVATVLAVAVAVVAGGLIIYYVPRRSAPAEISRG